MTDALKAAPAKPSKKRPKGGRKDPVVRVLLIFAVALMVVLIVATGFVFYYLQSLNDAPRTTAERDVSAFEIAVRERPDDTEAWTRLAFAYSKAGRHDEAIDTARRGREATSAAIFDIVEADLFRLAGRHQEAIAAYDSAEKKVKTAREKARKENEKAGVRMPDATEADSAVFYGRGLSRRALGDLSAAIADLEKAVEFAPNQANIQSDLGDMYAEDGDRVKAEAAYRAAVRFVPDHPGAISGLQRLGVSP